MTLDPYASRLYKRNRRLVLEAAAGKCYVPGCGRVATTADHIVALALGGSHDIENLRACCWHHNSAGGAQIKNELRRAKKIGHRSRRW